MKKSGKLFVRSLVSLTTVFTLLLCLLVARLIIAPIDLEFAKEEIDNQVSELLPGWQVSYQKATLGWDWQAVRPWIVISDLRLVDRRDRLISEIPSVQVGTSFSTLYGNIKISSVNAQGARVDILDIGAFSDDENTDLDTDLFGETGVPNLNILKPLSEAFSRFSNRLIVAAPKFKDLNIQNTTVTVNRGETIEPARLSASSITLERHDNTLMASSTVDVTLGGIIPTRVSVGADINPEEKELDLRLSFSELVPKDLVGYLQLPDFFTSLDFPFSLQVDFTLDAEAGLKQAYFLTHIDKGVLYHPSLFPKKAPIEFGNISAHFDPQEQVFVFDELELSLGKPRVLGSGVIYWLDDEERPGVRFNASLEAATIDEVLSFWPIARKPDGSEKGGRAWVAKHMIGGEAKNAKFNLDLPPDGKSTLKSGSPYELNFTFDDIDTHFILSMPPVRGAKGHAFLTETDLDIIIDSGTLVGLPVTEVKAELTNINSRDKSYGSFNFELAGPVPEILNLINNPPLRIPDKIKLDINRFDGTAHAKARIGTPLYLKPGENPLSYDVTAELSNLSVTNILDGEGIRNANAVMHITPEAIEAKGRARLNGVWSDFVWHEDLIGGRDNADLQTTQITASGTTDQNGLEALKIATSQYLNGEIDFEAKLSGRNFAFSSIDFTADAAKSKLMLQELGWVKIPGVPATISGKTRLSDNVVHLYPLTISGEDIDATGDFKWINNNLSGTFVAKQLGQNSFTADVTLPLNDKSRVTVKAERLDLRPFLTNAEASNAKNENNTATELSKTTQEKQASKANEKANARDIVELSIASKELLLLNGEALSDLKFQGTVISNQPYEISADGNIQSSGSPFSLSLKPLEQVFYTPTQQKLVLQSENGGAVMRGLGVFPHLNGGVLNLDVSSVGWADTWRLEGEVEIDDTLLVNKATLGEKVTEGLIEGIEEYVDSEGLALNVVEVPFLYDKGLLDLNGLKANGGSLGMTMEGQLDTNSGKINMNGVIVPAYGLNSLLGKIPLVGAIFSGGEGKGLFGFTYRIKGATDNPDVDVSALSGIAPGFLRGIFEGGKGKVEDVELPEEGEVKNDTASVAKDGQNDDKVSKDIETDSSRVSPKNQTEPKEDDKPQY
ncbi:AsmA-like C-terminal domain-containing protein [Kordiimonas sp. SCSIO 12610]|uniref:YhdP family protein n=1 Tax=Kordiimonas sp. SCSIO 12610 TaxID=2829597 RepID=UPI002109F2E5|nr:AsmA-like C-terminal domain-containing protein [Kordiimonas sp. SCSIO 12610]UTW53854.1 AsmA-like C-terminal domain-containing protein [Kordiimonas sp. SCSIO 12610]